MWSLWERGGGPQQSPLLGTPWRNTATCVRGSVFTAAPCATKKRKENLNICPWKSRDMWTLNRGTSINEMPYTVSQMNWTSRPSYAMGESHPMGRKEQITINFYNTVNITLETYKTM